MFTRIALWLKEQWYWCATCKCSFPASEMSSHAGHKTWPTDEREE